MSTFITRLSCTVAIMAISSCATVPAFAVANKMPTEPEPQITICHATNAQTNPYVQITVSADAIANTPDFNGHGAQHAGGVWYSGIADHAWGDIIPAFTTNDGIAFPGQNVTPAGEEILHNGCNVPEVTASETPPSTDTDQHTGAPVHTVTSDDSAAPATTAPVAEAPASAPAVTPTSPSNSVNVTELPHTGGIHAALGMAGVLGLMTYLVARRLII